MDMRGCHEDVKGTGVRQHLSLVGVTGKVSRGRGFDNKVSRGRGLDNTDVTDVKGTGV